MTGRDLDAVLASIDGALADDELPDAMRWSPEPAHVDAPAPFDGRTVYVGDEVGVNDPRSWLREYDRDHPRGRGLPVDHLIVDELYLVDPAHRAEVARERQEVQARVLDRLGIEHRADCSIVHEYADRPPACQCGALDRAALAMPRQHASVRCSIFPVFGEAVAAAQQHEAALAAVRRLFADMGEALRPLVEAFGRRAEETGKGLAEVVEEFRRTAEAGLRPIAPPRPPDGLRERDPAAYALQLRQSRGTGPDRQLQRQHRPRRHR